MTELKYKNLCTNKVKIWYLCVEKKLKNNKISLLKLKTISHIFLLLKKLSYHFILNNVQLDQFKLNYGNLYLYNFELHLVKLYLILLL